MSSQPVNWLGLDVAKDSFQAALLFEDGTTQNTSLPRTQEGAAALIAWAKAFAKHGGNGTPVRAVMEATGRYSEELSQWLDSLRPSIVNPELICAYAKSLGLRNKTDPLDARTIAQYGRERRPAPTEALSEEHGELREYVRTRQYLIKLRTAQKNRLCEVLSLPVVRKSHEAVIEVLGTQIAVLEKQMRQLCQRSQELGRDLTLLLSVPGIGETTAMVMLGELGDLRRFKNGRAIAAYVGLSPRLYQSGTSINKPARLCKKGKSKTASVVRSGKKNAGTLPSSGGKQIPLQ